MRTIIRNAIVEAMRKVCDSQPDFRTGFLPYMNAGGFALPCIWLCPLELTSKTGYTEGRKTYAGTVYLLDSIESLSAEQKDAKWDAMETIGCRILAEIVEADNPILAVEGIQGFPDEFAYTGFNTISVKMTFDVITDYCELAE